VGDMGRWVL